MRTYIYFPLSSLFLCMYTVLYQKRDRDIPHRSQMLHLFELNVARATSDTPIYQSTGDKFSVFSPCIGVFFCEYMCSGLIVWLILLPFNFPEIPRFSSECSLNVYKFSDIGSSFLSLSYTFHFF